MINIQERSVLTSNTSIYLLTSVFSHIDINIVMVTLIYIVKCQLIVSMPGPVPRTIKMGLRHMSFTNCNILTVNIYLVYNVI